MKSSEFGYFLRLISATLIALALAGCDERTMVRRGETQAVLGTHKVTIKPGSPHVRSTTTGVGVGRVYEYTCAEIRIILRPDDLLINQLSYGAIEPYDTILVSHGEVFINGEKAQGRPPAKQRDPRIMLNQQPESKSRLGGYTIRVRPGDPIKSRFHLQGAYVWRLGNRRFVVKNDEFFINDVSYGKLTTGDSIMVEDRRVYISGRERMPKGAGKSPQPKSAAQSDGAKP